MPSRVLPVPWCLVPRPLPRPAGAAPARPVGTVTRGTTAPNRLRRVDRWLAGTQAGRLRAAADPLVVDLGYGRTPTTTVELHARLRVVRPDVDVLGLEIDPERVRRALAHARPGLSFAQGGFEVPPAHRRPLLVRAFNVLRQYAEDEVAPAWTTMRARLAPDGLLVEGTCDELGRRASWVTVGPEGPRSLTLAAHLGSLERPGELAERLPKALIHRNVPGEPVHDLLAALDRAWAAAAPYGAFGARQRWAVTAATLRGEGWPLLDGPRRWRLGELTVAWPAVAPRPRVPGQR